MKIKWDIGTGYASDMRRPDQEFEIPDEDLEGLSDWDRSLYIDELVLEEFQNRYSLEWEIVED